MIYINLSSPYEEAVIRLKHLYAVKANQNMVEYLIRAEAMKLGLWPMNGDVHTTRDARLLWENVSCPRCGRDFERANVWPQGIPAHISQSIGSCSCGAQVDWVDMFVVHATEDEMEGVA